MVGIGDSLREARLRQRLELVEIERRTRIRARFLAALEEERFELLPGEVYAKGFLRTYASLLGLDGDLLVREYEARFARPPEQPLLPAEVPWRRRRLPGRLLLASTGAALVVVAALLVAPTLRRGGSPTSSPPERSAVRPSAIHPSRVRRERRARLRTAARPALTPVALRAVAAWDPDGDGHEHDEEAALATDGNPATAWRTETYAAGLQKPGVGLVLATAAPVVLARLTLETDTPGYTAEVEAGASPTGPFRPVSPGRVVAPTTSFPLHGGAARYYLVWITRLERAAHVDEVRGFRARRAGAAAGGWRGLVTRAVRAT